MIVLGERLKAERKRLGYTQNNFAEKMGVNVQSQIRYEGEKNTPDAGYLARFLALGGDVIFLLTGERSQPSGLTAEEESLLNSYRYIVSENGRKALMTVASALQVAEMMSSGLLVKDDDVA